ncbi:MAG: prepilin peptidase [Nevskiales bacterium]
MPLLESLQAIWPVLAIVAVFGLVVGSFLNVVILRLPVRLEYDWRKEAKALLGQSDVGPEVEPPGLAFPPSRCASCQTTIKPWHNIPVFGWLWLRGRCAACGSSISIQYPLIELACGFGTALVVWRLGLSWEAAAALLLTWSLLALAAIDARHRLLPDVMTLPLLWIGLGLSLMGIFTDAHSSILGAIGGYLSLWAVFQLFLLLTGKEGMGYGDFKLFAALGAWLGWQKLPLIILLASAAGALVGGALLMTGRLANDRALPFGPYLAAAGWIALLWGDQLVGAYLHIADFG